MDLVAPEMPPGRVPFDRTYTWRAVAMIDMALDGMASDRMVGHQEKASVVGQLRQRDRS